MFYYGTYGKKKKTHLKHSDDLKNHQKINFFL